MAQDGSRIDVVRADLLEYAEKGQEKIRKLVGEVRLRQKEMIMDCDSAYHYLVSDFVEAFGHIHIVQDDTIQLYGDKLIYDGKSRKAEVTGKVVLDDGSANIRTDRLFYDANSRTASYRTGAEIRNGPTLLTSQRGAYHSAQKMAYFKQDVHLRDERYELCSDTLAHDVEQRISYFLAPTWIKTGRREIFCRGGWYDSRNDRALFADQARFASGSERILADSIFYNKSTGYGRARGQVTIADTTQDLMVRCQKADYSDSTNILVATDRAYMTYVMDQDSLHISGDTLKSVTDSGGEARRLFAYRNVRMLKSNLQGSCDSLIYDSADSSLSMFHEPYLWSDSSQFNADTIFILIRNRELDKVLLRQNAFIGTRNDSLIFNQIKGKSIDAYFAEDSLRKVLVDGNGETIYYVQDDGGGYVGVNKAVCSRMWIYIKMNKVDRISFLGSADATMFPIQQIDTRDFILDRFAWRDDLRPLDKPSLWKPLPVRRE